MDLFFIFPTISTSFIVLSAVLVAIGWILIIKGHRDAHKKVMIGAAVSALVFFIIYTSRTIFIGNTEWGGPEDLQVYYQIFLISHIILATVAAVFGITTLTLGFKAKFAKHRKWGKVTAIMWFFTAITGVMVYLLLYILYPGGHTIPMWKVILGI
ncbi:DUF420 domain-containing protein [Paenibacillus crassostreae]|uniref:DUF420 domain-containing protein n=1 Tax=Paenibacillus crassostreae TaxID=1763538 RepID=A0A167BS72_9BACL|nr:DUF420 domain-containing protein [Paenibacillus crassostreae]AOZ92433.1 hypothetical protein LPB68_09435 [Paenibacillus crassostreae]OAB72381.1 hypothetical protein PNBC_15880 [Paenibacillus crassostreae]